MNRKILRLAIPNIITNITVPLLGMVDLAIVGRLGNDTLIGAMAIGTAIFNFIYWNFGFLRMGTSGFAAQALGAKDLAETMRVLVRAVAVAVGIAVLLLVCQLPLKWLSMSVMSGSDEVERLAADYFFVRIWAAPATLGLYAIKGWFIGMQNSKIPMWIAIVINILNIVFSLFFAFTMDMGIRGVALGTVVAQWGGVLMSLVMFRLYYWRLAKYFDVRHSFSIGAMGRFFSVNRDIFLRTICLVAVFTFFTSASTEMGDTLLAVNSLLMQLFILFSYMMDGFAYAGEALTGRYYGAKNWPLLRKCVGYLFGWGAVMALLFTAGYAAAGTEFLRLFTSSDTIVAAAGDYYFWVLAVPIVSFAAFLLDGVLVGITASSVMRNAMFVATAVFFGVYYLLVSSLGNDALWIAFLIYLLLRGVLQFIFGRREFLR